MDTFGIIAFRSRQAVLSFQKVLEKRGIKSSVIHTPSAISLGCGLSVRFSLPDLLDVAGALVSPYTQSLIGVYAAHESVRGTELIPLDWNFLKNSR